MAEFLSDADMGIGSEVSPPTNPFRVEPAVQRSRDADASWVKAGEQSGFEGRIHKSRSIPGAADDTPFYDWYRSYATKLGLNKNPDDPQHFYDWRAAYAAGAKPDASGHWPSKYKLEGHPRMVLDGVNTKTGKPATGVFTPKPEYLSDEAMGIPKPSGFSAGLGMRTDDSINFLKDWWTGLSTESLPANLITAYKKGVFDKPVREILGLKDTPPSRAAFAETPGGAVTGRLSLRQPNAPPTGVQMNQVLAAIKADPHQFLGKLARGMLVDPELLFVPLGTARIAGRGTRAVVGGATGGGINAGITSAQQLTEVGQLSRPEIEFAGLLGAALTGPMSALFGRGGAPKPAAARTEAPQFRTGDWSAAPPKRGLPPGELRGETIEGEATRVQDGPLALPDLAKSLGIGAGVYLAMKEQFGGDGAAMGLAMALAAKPKGGMWHPKAAEVVSNPIAGSLTGLRGSMSDLPTLRALQTQGNLKPEYAAAIPLIEWSQKASSTYLNRHMGTESDPLREIEIPFGEGTKKWGEVTDALIVHRTALQHRGLQDRTGASEIPFPERIPPDEKVWELQMPGREYDNAGGMVESGKAQSARALNSYLSHVGDYLRENVEPAKLPQYDLVRAVKETARRDAEMAKAMEREAAASSADLPVYKDYGDGFRWVELKKPERLTEVQAKSVREATGAEAAFTAVPGDSQGSIRAFVALGQDGKPIKNNYTADIAIAKTPEEAYLAGQLAREGNQMGHCVGGYCEPVASGEARIFSLRDGKGKSHVTVESVPSVPSNAQLMQHDSFQSASFFAYMKDHGFQMDSSGRWLEPYRTGQVGRNFADTIDIRNGMLQSNPQLREFIQNAPENIQQIKGKQNRAPAAEYLPYVQDFVKGGKWGEVGDLEGTGLLPHLTSRGSTQPYIYKAGQPSPEQIGLPPGYYTKQELHDAYVKAGAEPEVGAGTGYYKPPERGSIDPKLLARLAAGGAGAALGAYLNQENPLWGSILGGLGAVVATRISPSGVLAAVRRAMQPGKLVKIDNLAREAQYDVKAARRAAWQITQDVIELVPKEADRIQVRKWLEGSDTRTELTPNQREAANILRQAWNERGLEGLASSVLKDLRYNYVTHVWGDSGRTVWDEIFNKPTGSGTSENTPFSMKRVYATIEEGKAAGLTPLTEDPLLLFEIYANSLARAISNKKFISALKSQTHDGRGLVTTLARGGEGYERIDHPQMQGLSVHPDIAPMMRFIFDSNNPNVLVKGLEAVSTIQKRLAVSASLFHAKALEDAMLGATKFVQAPGRAVKTLGQSFAPAVFGRDSFLKQLREGGPGDLVDRGMKAGLQFAFEREGAGLEELNTGWYQGLSAAQRFLDDTIPGLGLPVKGFQKLSHTMDNFMWGRLHAALKLNTFAEKSTQLTMNEGKAAAKEGRPPRAQEETDRIAASFANDIYGGLNWQQLVTDFDSRWGREFAQALFGPSGRRAMRIALFAPDWTLSTTRAFVKAFSGEGSGVAGLFKPRELADLHRQYILRSLFWYALIGDSLNVYFSGHHFWENKDKTRIDLGDGRTMQWSKHFMEPIHWITDTAKQGLNKLGIVPKEVLNQTFGTEYLNPRVDRGGSIAAGPAMKGTRVGHALRQFAPISGQQYSEGDLTSAVSGFLGAPVYGKTYDQREEAKEQRRQQRLLKRLEK